LGVGAGAATAVGAARGGNGSNAPLAIAAGATRVRSSRPNHRASHDRQPSPTALFPPKRAMYDTLGKLSPAPVKDERSRSPPAAR